MNCCHLLHQGNQVLSSNSLLPYIAIIVSIISLVFSFLTTRHNKKTVEPILTDYYIVNHSTINSDYPFQSYQIKNCGFGPAVIKSLTFTINDKRYKEIMTLIKDNSQNILYDTRLSSTSMIENYIITPNEEKILFKLYFTALSGDSFRKFQELLSNISLRVDYETIYKEKKTLNRDKLIRI